MYKCPNCGAKKYIVLNPPGCGCTWSEQIEAMRRKERERRDEALRRGERPVKVDHQRTTEPRNP